MYEEVVEFKTRSLAFVPDCFKTEDMYNKVVGRDTYTLGHVPDNLKTQEMCNEAMRENQAGFFPVPDRFKNVHNQRLMPLMSTHISCMMYLITLKRKKCVTMWCSGAHVLCSLSLNGFLLKNN